MELIMAKGLGTILDSTFHFAIATYTMCIHCLHRKKKISDMRTRIERMPEVATELNLGSCFKTT